MTCKKCNNIVLHAEQKDGMCPLCYEMANDPAVAHTRAAFVSGRKLLVEMLDHGSIFSPMSDQQDMHVQNYLLTLIGEALGNDPKKYRTLTERFVNDIIELSGETDE